MAKIDEGHFDRDNLLNICWINCASSKVCCFIWKALRGRLATKGEFQRRHIASGVDSNYVFCGE
ncbi:putative reverse transcriptase zinc-binding domain-containing protein [Lupinus albus]|uniref:Putative reverse transcriptase zinc-binding domain-containing protein n=1 Tax=Lupinus albus TaxID=3870 RepID=A0A6A4P048_LUPAL|nr:putative reverse transcriptase zinc-binding domain-containing protein [Lupinus albus]